MTEGRPQPEWPRVIVTKVRPPRRRRDLLTRARLNEIIDGSLDRKILLVSAPAGYGKTSLLVDYAHTSGIPVCWYRIDPGDRDPVVFLEHVIESIRQRFPDACSRSAELLRAQSADGGFDHMDAVGALVNDIAEDVGPRFLLVLDDYQSIDDADRVNRTLDSLLHYLPENCLIVIVSRTIPRKLTLTRLAGAGQAAGIGPQQLSFTAAEVEELMSRVHGCRPSPDESRRLARASEGWVMALAMGGRRLIETDARETPDREGLFAFLANEVLMRESPGLQDFLLRTSILDDLSAELCDAVLVRDDSRRTLAALESRNLFLSRAEGDHTWFRYHPLFRDFLRERLAAEDHDVRGLHLRAAAWSGANHRPEEEIRHLLDAGETDVAASRMLEATAAAQRHGRWQAVVRWVTALPAETLSRHPLLELRLGTALATAGDLRGARLAYGAALARYEAAGDDDGAASVLVRRSVLWRILGRREAAMADARRALERVSESEGVTAGQAYRALGGTLAVDGQLDAAVRALESALRCFGANAETALAANVHSDLSAVHQWAGHVDLAIEHARAAKDGWESLGHLPALAVTLNNLGTAHHQRGELESARRWLTEAVIVSERSGGRRAEAAARVSLGDLLTDVDELEAAAAQLDRGIAIATSVGDTTLAGYALASRAEIRRLTGDLPRASADLRAAGEALRERGPAYESAHLAYVAGAISLDGGDSASALSRLEEAADKFSSLGAHRDEALAALYAAHAARRVGNPWAEGVWRTRADTALARLANPGAVAAHLRRLGEEPAGLVPAIARKEQSSTVAPIGRAAGLVVQAFGVPAVWADGRRIDRSAWQSASAEQLFYLLADHPEGLSRERLMLELWPEADERSARRALNTAVYRVRRALGEKASVELVLDRCRLGWPTGIVYDVSRFDRLRRSARAAAGHGERAALLDEALSLVRGEYMDGCPAEWCASRRVMIDGQVTSALLALGAARLALGEALLAADAFRAALERDSLREEGHRGLMAAYAALGDRAMAARQYEACVAVLRDELGVDPDPRTTALRTDLLP